MSFRVRARYKTADAFVHAYERWAIRPNVLRVYVDPGVCKPYVEVKAQGNYELWLMRSGRRPCVVWWNGNQRLSLMAGDIVEISVRDYA